MWWLNVVLLWLQAYLKKVENRGGLISEKKDSD